MAYFVRTEFLLGGIFRTHTVREFSDGAAAIDFAASQTADEVVGVKIYDNEEDTPEAAYAEALAVLTSTSTMMERRG